LCCLLHTGLVRSWYCWRL